MPCSGPICSARSSLVRIGLPTRRSSMFMIRWVSRRADRNAPAAAGWFGDPFLPLPRARSALHAAAAAFFQQRIHFSESGAAEIAIGGMLQATERYREFK